VLLLLLIAAAQVSAMREPQPAPAEIVVVARSRKCDVSVANRVLSDAEFKRRATEWAAGTPVRVVAPPDTDYRCLAKIAFRLADRGVKKIIFDP
jgi:hypothetical protein